MFRAYLKQVKAQSVQNTSHFVIGNSSVDFDSFFGSIILAFMMSTATSKLHLPLIDCKSQQLKNRFEIAYVLDKLKIDSNIFRYQSSILDVPKQSMVTLYDHNKRKEMTKIDYIFDHHEPDAPVGRKIFIQKMGSCLTHLYFLLYPSKLQLVEPTTQEQKEYITFFNSFLIGEPFQDKIFEENKWPEIEEIIRYGILIDTFNFDKSQKDRWTVFDKQTVEFIEKDQNFDVGYKQFYDLKFDETLNRNLSLEAALSKDFKCIQYSSLTINYSNIYLEPENFLKHYSDALKNKFDQQEQISNNVYMLMSITKRLGSEEGVERALIFRTKNQEHLHLITSFLQSLKMDEKGTIDSWHWWKDPSNAISRKLFDKELKKWVIELKEEL